MPRTPGVCQTVFCCRPYHSLITGPRILATLFPVGFFWRISTCALCLLFLLITHNSYITTVHAQGATSTLSGTVTDPNGAVVPGVNVSAISIAQGFQRSTSTNDDGAFVIAPLPPGNYIVKAEREGFTTAEVRDVELNINEQVAIKIQLKIGTLTGQTVDIVDGLTLIDESPSVGTVIDRQFVANLPLNGQSFQSLITLTPGVVLTKTVIGDQGQFSVNGQRTNANYFMVDGVSANIGISTIGQNSGGNLPGFAISGGTNNLVSVDALQEFKILTSTYAPEFGRTPGAQISIATRSGTNDFHGAAFDYFRNDVLDANDWFANRDRLVKPALRHNDFGFVLGGPILLPRFGEGGDHFWYNGRNKTFFFFSYEGQRLRQPLVGNSDVPTLTVRQTAPAALQPFLNAYPLPNGPDKGNGYAGFSASFSNPLTFDAIGIRVDHVIKQKLNLFVRYNHAPSETSQRGALGRPLNNLIIASAKAQTLTAGATFWTTPNVSNDFRINYSRNTSVGSNVIDNFGAATIPPDSILFPSFTSSHDALLTFALNNGSNANYSVGAIVSNAQRQLNLVDNLLMIVGNHQLKFGVDYRRLTPIIRPRTYAQSAIFLNVTEVLSGRPFTSVVSAEADTREPLFTNLSVFGQDTWHATQRLTLTYGLRWEVNPPPSVDNGAYPAVVTGLDNPASLALAPYGTPLYKTTYNNFAPRVGVAYQLSQRSGRETVLRGGFGLFYDLGTGTTGNVFNSGSFPFAAFRSLLAQPYPLSPANAAPPTISTNLPTTAFVYAFDPNLELPKTYQWNLAVERSLGSNQTISATYLGAAGRRLLRPEALVNPNSNFGTVRVTRNAATSDYRALQLQYNRRLSRGLQALASYTLSRSLDNFSNDNVQLPTTPASRIDPQLDRGPSDFDVRHAFNAAVTYNLPTPGRGALARTLFGDWAVDTIFTARSATPINVIVTRNIGFGSFGFRPDLVPDIPLFLNDPTAPGGRRINNNRVAGSRQVGPFFIPTENRQGTLPRNALRGFPLWQTDLSVRRQFKITERVNLQFRTDFFNIFNHPNFADPFSTLGSATATSVTINSTFGVSPFMLGRSLGSGGTNGGFNPLFQIGGPRSIQLSLKLQF